MLFTCRILSLAQAAPANEAWPESYIAFDNMAADRAIEVLPLADTISNVCIVAGIIAMFLFAFGRIAEGLYAVAVSVFDYKRLVSIERQANLYTSRNALLVFSIVVSSFIFANYNEHYPLLDNDFNIGINFLLCLASVAGYFMLRYFLFRIFGWTNRNSIFKYLNRFYYTHAIMGIVLSTLVFLAYMIFPAIAPGIIIASIMAMVSITLFTYFIRGYQIIISNGFSHFFWILYLCTLEILPLLVIGHIILS